MSLLDSCVTVSATSKQEQEFNENKLREIAFAEKVFGALLVHCGCASDCCQLGLELDQLVQKMPIVTQVSCTRTNSVNQLVEADYEQLFNWDVSAYQRICNVL